MILYIVCFILGSSLTANAFLSAILIANARNVEVLEEPPKEKEIVAFYKEI